MGYDSLSLLVIKAYFYIFSSGVLVGALVVYQFLKMYIKHLKEKFKETEEAAKVEKRKIEEIAKDMVAKAQKEANHDLLTGLPNSRLFEDRLSQAGHAVDRSHSPKSHEIAVSLALMFVDLDKFKEVNDTFGHHFGDELLKLSAGRMKNCVRTTDTVARLGGDEFGIILTGITGDKELREVATKILSKINRPFNISGQRISISASIGIAVYLEDGDDLRTVLKHADVAMYKAKKDGRNRYCLYRDKTDESNSTTLRVVV